MAKPKQLTRLGLEHVTSVMRRSPSLSAAARELGVRQSTVSRWVKLGKVPEPGLQRRRAVPASQVMPSHRPPDRCVGNVPLPEDWAATIRREWELTPAHDRVLTLAEQAYRLSLDEKQTATARLAAGREYTRLMDLLGIREDIADEPPKTTGATVTAFRRA